MRTFLLDHRVLDAYRQVRLVDEAKENIHPNSEIRDRILLKIIFHFNFDVGLQSVDANFKL